MPSYKLQHVDRLTSILHIQIDHGQVKCYLCIKLMHYESGNNGLVNPTEL